MQSAIESYNDNEHRTLKTTPNKAWSNNNLQIAHHLNDAIHNENIYKTVPFKSGEQVRVLEDKDTFSKGKNKFSHGLYTVDSNEGYKIKVKDTTGDFIKVKPSELLKSSVVDNPLTNAFIKAKSDDKKAGKVINSLIKNAKMTPTQAKAAVKQLQQNSQPPAQSTRPRKVVINYARYTKTGNK